MGDWFMKNFSAFPIWDENNKVVVDGTLISASLACSKIKKKICTKHYEKIKNKKGFHVCPAGLTTFSDGNGKLYSSFKAKNYYDITKTKKLDDFIPTVPAAVFLDSINKSNTLITSRVSSLSPENTIDSDMIDFSIHEVRRFNGTIKRLSEEILLMQNQASDAIIKKVKSVFASSSLISVRLNAFDLEENPDVITSQSMFNNGVYKKFQKASHCLDSYAKDNNVKILPFKGKSHLTIDMYQIFDLIPFVILENAIKYSPKSQTVQVEFDEVNLNLLEVKITSKGPTSSKEELASIFTKKCRGKNATLVDGTGGGYGLYFAKTICEMHGIQIEAYSQPTEFQLEGVEYSEFYIKLSVTK